METFPELFIYPGVIKGDMSSLVGTGRFRTKPVVMSNNLEGCREVQVQGGYMEG